MTSSIDPKILEALVKASRIDRPKRIEWDFEHFLIEAQCEYAETRKALKPPKATEPEKDTFEQPEKDLVDFLKDYQEKNGVSARAIAKEIGISRTTFQTFLESERLSHRTTVQRIRRFKNKIQAKQPAL